VLIYAVMLGLLILVLSVIMLKELKNGYVSN